MNGQFDVAIVGAGIVGLAHAWRAAQAGWRVGLFERSRLAQGASIRNFGMVWPIGQPWGELRQIALRSRELWLQLAKEAGIWCQPCGSLHLAHRPDEQAVLEEFVSLPGLDVAMGNQHALPGGASSLKLLTPDEVHQLTPAANPDGLRCGLWSPSECCVNPPEAIATMPHWLKATHAVQCEFNTTICCLDGQQLLSSDGRRFAAERIVICSGHDFQTLLPAAFAEAQFKICKLHMLKTVPQAAGWRIGPHLASGLTLRHYTSFAACPSLAQLKRRVQAETPELDRFGIHVMASQNQHGEIVLGDSHEYDDDIQPFDRVEIDELILRELRKQFAFPNWTLGNRWHGIYAKHAQRSIWFSEPQPNVHVCVAPGGAGMTMSFGFADRFWSQQWTPAELVPAS